MGFHSVLTLLYLNNVLYWPEDDRLRSKHVAIMRLDCIYRVIRNDCRGFNNLSVWNELDYRVDVCRITKGAHIEHL